jgi:hypothetical protein
MVIRGLRHSKKTGDHLGWKVPKGTNKYVNMLHFHNPDICTKQARVLVKLSSSSWYAIT